MKNLLKTKQAIFSSLLVSGILLSGCGADKQDIELDSVQPTEEQAQNTKGSPIFNPLTSELPFPNDLLFAGSTDGTLNIPVDDAADISDPKNSLNELDGFAVSGAMSVGLSKAMKADNLPTAVKLFKVPTDATTKAVTGITAALTYGVDYVASLSADSKTLVILPLKPLAAKSSYMVVITNDLTDVDDNAAISGTTYAYLKLATPLADSSGKSLVDGLPDTSAASLEPVRQLTQAQLASASAAGVDKNKVIISWSFSTQSTTDVINKVTDSVANTSLALADSTLTTADAGVTGGTAKIFAGTLTVPYYQSAPSTENPTAPLVSKWAGQTGTALTQYSILAGDSPKKTEDVTIPVIATTPSAGCNNCPVVIYQHGITTNRATVLAVADSYAAVGYAMIAIDMPMHGITPTSSAAGFRIPGVTERTFDLNFVTQNEEGAITASVPDDVVDSSGRHFVQLTSLLTTRDNLRQAVSDLVQLKSSLASATDIDFDETKVHFLGHSLGGMVGANFVNIATDLKSASFAMSGTQAAYILTNSASFGPEIAVGLALKGIEAGSADFASFELAAQAVMDSADPISVLDSITVPTLLLEVVGDGNTGTDDQVIPNAIATAPLAGTEAWIKAQGLNTVTGTGAVTDGKGVIRFTAGEHGSILDPTSSLAVTTAMQEAVVSFAVTGGTAVSITSDETIKQ